MLQSISCRNDLAGRLRRLTVKVNLDHLRNEITLRLGQELPLITLSCKSMHNFLHEAAHRPTDRKTDLMA